MGWVVQAEPAAEPITTAEAKVHLRLETTADDSLVAALVKAARIYVERATNRCLYTQTLDLYLDEFPASDSSCIWLPRGPVQSITSVVYQNTSDVATTVAAASYVLDATQEPARLCLADGYSWPGDTLAEANAVRVRYAAGYGAAASVPDDLKALIYLLVGHWYEHREGVVTGTISTALAHAVDALIDARRVLIP